MQCGLVVISIFVILGRMKILVTGHKGFIASQVYKHLLESGYDTSGFDLGDPFPTERYDFIAHFAARTLIRKSKELPYEYFKDGEDLTMRILELARKTDARIVFPTSGSEARATNPYSLSKKHAVDWVNLYGELYGVENYVLKLFNIYGEESRKGAVYLFNHAALFGEEAVIYGDGNHKRDFTHVSDVAKVVHFIVNGKILPGSYEVGTGVPTSVVQLLSSVERISGKSVKVRHENYILDEAEDLHAKKPVLEKFVALDDGIQRVISALQSDK